MNELLVTANPVVLRTDFSNSEAWKLLCEIITNPVDNFCAEVDFINDRQFDNLTKEQLLQFGSAGHYEHEFIFVADKITMTDSEHPLLVFDFTEEASSEFRALPTQIQAIENNLSLANMDFDDFASNVDGSGIFRGFSS